MRTLQHGGDGFHEAGLVERLRGRDEAAYAELYDRFSPALYGVILRIVRREEIAADVLQDSFVKIWKGIDSYDAAQGRLFTWLLTICRNTSLDRIRSKGYRQSQTNRSLDDVVDTGDGRVVSENPNVDAIGLDVLVEALDPDHRRVIDALYFGGLTQSEASEQLGIPLGTVKTRARNALLRLREAFSIE